MKVRNPKHSLDPIDLTGWEITCAEFIPRRQHQAVKTPDHDTVFRSRTLFPIKKKMDQDGNPTQEHDSVCMLVILSLENNQPRDPSNTNRCINYVASKQKVERKRQWKEHKRQQKERKKQIDLIRLEQPLVPDLPVSFYPGISGRDSF